MNYERKLGIMSDKKIVVPEGMLAAAGKELRIAGFGDNVLMCNARRKLEPALEWLRLSEHPIVPSDQEVVEILDKVEPYRNWLEMVKRVIEIWQRQMFIATEPELPEELKTIFKDTSKWNGLDQDTKDAIWEAYRRGLESKDNVMCGIPVAVHIAREGSYFPCALPKNHVGDHCAAGRCHIHGPYLGEAEKVPRCPACRDIFG